MRPGKQSQTITCITHTHTCKRYCKMRSPGAALYLYPTPPLTFSFILFSCALCSSTPTATRTLDGTPKKCLNIYFYINRNLGFLIPISCCFSFLVFFLFAIYYSPFSMRACFVRSLIEFSLLRSAFASFRFAPLRSLPLSLGFTLYKLYLLIYLPKYTVTHGILLFFTLRFGPTIY